MLDPDLRRLCRGRAPLEYTGLGIFEAFTSAAGSDDISALLFNGASARRVMSGAQRSPIFFTE